MIQFSRFKHENDKTGLLLWNSMRKQLTIMRASKILIITKDSIISPQINL